AFRKIHSHVQDDWIGKRHDRANVLDSTVTDHARERGTADLFAEQVVLEDVPPMKRETPRDAYDLGRGHRERGARPAPVDVQVLGRALAQVCDERTEPRQDGGVLRTNA